MNRNELTKKLNDLLVGESAYYNAHVCDFIYKHLGDLGLDNTQGDYFVRYDNYTFTIMWKQRCLVSLNVKRKQDNKHGFIVKEVIVEDEFVDYETSHARIKESYKRDIARLDDWCYLENNNLETLKETLRIIRTQNQKLTKVEQLRLIEDLGRCFWLVDEALESEEK